MPGKMNCDCCVASCFVLGARDLEELNQWAESFNGLLITQGEPQQDLRH